MFLTCAIEQKVLSRLQGSYVPKAQPVQVLLLIRVSARLCLDFIAQQARFSAPAVSVQLDTFVLEVLLLLFPAQLCQEAFVLLDPAMATGFHVQLCSGAPAAQQTKQFAMLCLARTVRKDQGQRPGNYVLWVVSALVARMTRQFVLLCLANTVQRGRQ